jgi:hypothetical protein
MRKGLFPGMSLAGKIAEILASEPGKNPLLLNIATNQHGIQSDESENQCIAIKKCNIPCRLTCAHT